LRLAKLRRDGVRILVARRRRDVGCGEGAHAAGHAERFGLVWCRDVLVHVADLARAYTEFGRVLRPGGRVLAYQVFGIQWLEPREAEWLWDTMGVVAASADPANTDAAIAAAGRLSERA
jgi:SAM-dependent methyltransferase